MIKLMSLTLYSSDDLLLVTNCLSGSGFLGVADLGITLYPISLISSSRLRLTAFFDERYLWTLSTN